jgi:hypothetical protein
LYPALDCARRSRKDCRRKLLGGVASAAAHMCRTLCGDRGTRRSLLFETAGMSQTCGSCNTRRCCRNVAFAECMHDVPQRQRGTASSSTCTCKCWLPQTATGQRTVVLHRCNQDTSDLHGSATQTSVHCRSSTQAHTARGAPLIAPRPAAATTRSITHSQLQANKQSSNDAAKQSCAADYTCSAILSTIERVP